MRIVKKYPNRRLYDTATSRYIKLAEVHELIRNNEDVQVVDSETGEDLTRSVLIQIILEQENNGDQFLFTTDMLTRMIRFYDDTAHDMFAPFLEQNMEFFKSKLKTWLRRTPCHV